MPNECNIGDRMKWFALYQRGFIHNFRHNKKESQSMKSNRISLKVTFDLINIVEFNLT